jgi:undecaprenyl diphosphate synthase
MSQLSQSDLKPILREPFSAEELEAFKQLRLEHLPRHVAVIMDGNGRWAKNKGFAARIFGHRAGIDSVRNITRTAAALRLHGLTLYAFSKENWSRPKKEINGLMELLDQFLKEEVPELMENNVRLVASGDLDDLREKTRKRLDQTIEATAGNTGLTLNLALSYSGRAEVIRAVQNAMTLSAEGKMSPEELNAESFSQLLDHPELGDPELLIRTSGEMRVSNFLLWQIAYTEFVITETLWPDFRRIHFLKALAEYQQRDRRFGGVS